MKKTVKICIYNKSSSKNDVLLGNGDAILDNICLECKVHENLDGTYEIDAEFIIDNEGLWQHIEEEAILKVRLDYGYEYFRITQPRKTSNRIIVYGRQVTIYETMHLWLTDVRPENQNGAGALHWILDNATGIKELEVASDIQTVSTAYYMDMNMYEALHDCDQSFFNRWGGEIQRRGYTLRINQRIGTDRGVEIRSRKNLTGFEAKTNIDNVVTRIKPKGFDGITIDGFVDSEYINKYPRIKTKEIKYENVKVKGENSEEGFETLAGAQAELTRLAKLEYTDNKIDVITAEYNISFVDLSKTEEYKEYVAAERVYLGDTVNVYEEKLDINVSVRAIDRVYDVLGERVEEIKLSNKDINKLHSMNDILTDILKGVQENDNSLQLYIQNIINSGIQDSYVFYNKAELVICDSPEIENAINVWRFNRGGLAHSSNGYSGPYNVAITYDGKINADMILAGLIKGNYIDAKNLTVTRTDGTKTLEVTAGGDVNLNVNSLKIQSEDVATKSLVTQTADSITTSVSNTYASKSELTQTADSITAKFDTIDYPNLMPNSNPKQGLYTGWETSNGAFFINNTGGASAGILLSGQSTEGFGWSPRVSVTPGKYYSVSISLTAERNTKGAEVYIIGSNNEEYGYDQIVTIGTCSNDNTWRRLKGTFKAETTSIRLRIDNNGLQDTSSGNNVGVYFADIMLVSGQDVYPRWTESISGLSSGITKIDKYGVHVTHEDGSSTNLNPKALNFYDSSNNLYAQVNGGLYKFWNGSQLIGYLGHSKWVNSDKRAAGVNSEYGHMSTLASKTSSGATSYQTYVIANGCDQTINSVRYRPGVTLINPHIGTRLYLYTNGYYTDDYPSFIVNNNEGHIILAGDNGVNIGALVGNDYYDAIRVTEIGSSPYVQIDMWGNVDMHNWNLVNVNISKSVNATSATSYSLRSLSEEESYSDPTASTITDIYEVQSLTNGDVRWSDKQTYFTSEVEEGIYEAYVEIPWWLAQNIELDYHVNITPVNGFYQYYVSERDTYYFCIRSDKDSMGFTFELVATLLEQNTLNNNASIASEQYLGSEVDDGEQPDISIPEIGKNIS